MALGHTADGAGQPILLLSLVPDTCLNKVNVAYLFWLSPCTCTYFGCGCSGEPQTGPSGVLPGKDALTLCFRDHWDSRCPYYIRICVTEGPSPHIPQVPKTDTEYVDINSASTSAFRWILVGDHSVQDTWPIHHVEAGISKVPHLSLEHYKRSGQGSWRGYHCR